MVMMAVVDSASGSSYLYKGDGFPILEFTEERNDFRTSSAPKIVELYSPHCVSTGGSLHRESEPFFDLVVVVASLETYCCQQEVPCLMDT